MQYQVGSTNGAWTDVSGGTVTVADDFTSGVLSSLALPSACEGQTFVFLRWIMTSNTNTGGGAVAAGGSSRMDDLIIAGSAAVPTFVSGYSNLAVVATSQLVSGLTPSTPYYFRVRSTNDTVVSANSITQSVMTLSYDVNTVVDDPTSQVAVGTVSSLSTTNATPEDVFSFDITDAGTSDGQPTHVTQVTIKPDAGNTASWVTNLAGVVLKSGSTTIPASSTNLTDSSIVFTLAAGTLDVANGTSSNLTLAVYVKTSGIVDGAVLDFKVDAASHGFTATAAGSTFTNTLAADVAGNSQTIDIAASQLVFTSVPTHVATNRSFTVYARAQDAIGNRDMDAVQSVSIAAHTGSGTLTTDGAKLLVQGTNGWVISYDTLGAFTIDATNSGLTSVSASITGGTALVAGDIQIIGYNSDNPDGLAFVTWTALAAGTHIIFTDNGWSNTAFRTGESSGMWVSSGSVAAGTVVLVTNVTASGPLSADQGTAFSGSLDSLAASTDQIFALQGSIADPALLFGLDFNSTVGWDAYADSANNSGLPPALSATTANLSVAAADNGQYTATRTGPLNTLKSATVVSGNWTFSGAPVTLNSTDFTIAEAISFTTTSGSVSEGGGSTLLSIELSSTANVTANVAVVSGSASFGTDFTLSSTTVVFSAGGILTNQITVFLTEDLFIEGTETANFQIHNISGISAGSTNFALSITDNDGTLAAGDLAIIGMDDALDAFSLVALTDISAGTVVYFTDNGYSTADGLFRGATLTDGQGSEDLLKLTFNSTVVKGTIIRSDIVGAAYTFDTSSLIPGGSGESFITLALANGGDQINMFQAASTNPIVSVSGYLFVLDDTAGFENATSASTGTNTPGTVVGTTAITLPFSSSTLFGLNMSTATSPTFFATKAEWLTYIGNSNNWSTGSIPSGASKLWFTPPQSIMMFK